MEENPVQASLREYAGRIGLILVIICVGLFHMTMPVALEVLMVFAIAAGSVLFIGFGIVHE